MRYSSAVVLSTVVVGQAAAANMHNRHASFHARRQAESKRSAGNDVDWSKVAYDLGDVNWNSVFATPTPTPTPAAAPKVSVPDVKAEAEAEAKPTPSAPKEEPLTTPSAKPAATPAESNDVLGDIGDALSNIGDDISDAVSDLLDGVQEWAEKLQCKTGLNKKSSWNGIWIGDDGKWKAEFINDRSNEDMLLSCWQAKGFSGMSLNVNSPDVLVKVPAGKSVSLSFQEKMPSACAPLYPSTALAQFGGVNNTWWEVTFGKDGAFDVSRNINMNGDSISSKGSKCVSDMETCVFKCKNGMDTCEKGTDYDLYNCNASGGGGGGYDVVMAGTGGGCSMGQDSETVKVVFS
ncbi:hypothetical protein G6011_05443 [Alternaria panax]|uniref:Uncharacterized protein n=1 Tax=Alternaria panax TaxID=48097 RepID=A0AAD4I6R3_9PLEO|nr:hypothetical protein G6011_05443 [Alternaria panax]